MSSAPPYRALREAITGPDGKPISQRFVERELGWKTGRLSTIERGLIPGDEERRALLGYLNARITEQTGNQ